MEDKGIDPGRNSWLEWFMDTVFEEVPKDAEPSAEKPLENNDTVVSPETQQNKAFWPSCRGFGGFARSANEGR